MKTVKSAVKRGVRQWSRHQVVTVIIATVVIFMGLGTAVWTVIHDRQTDIDPKGYQAVFLTNGQVYFGKLAPLSGTTMKLTRIFYLQKSDSNDSANPQDMSTSSGNVQLIKLGSEVHGPTDEMVITKTQILFYENLKSDGSVSQTIQKYGSTQ